MTPEEAAELEDVHRSTIFRRLDAGDYRAIPTEQTSSNGRPIRLIDPGSLSEDAYRRWLERTRGQMSGYSTPIDQLPSQPKAGVPVTPDGLPDLWALKCQGREREIKIFSRRIEAATTVRRLLETAPHGRRDLVWRTVAAQYDMTPATLRRIEAEFRAGGPAALVPGYGHGRGKIKAIPEDLQMAIRETWLQPTKRNAQEIYRHVVRPWCRDRGLPVPHYSTVSRFVRTRILPLEAVMLREGTKAWENGSRPHIFRDVTELDVNELWCADHRKLDVFVYPPDGARKAIRPWVTAIADVRSAAFVGYRLCVTPSSDSIACSLRQAILAYGLPRTYYRDNGRDFQAARFGGNAASHRGVPWDDLSRYPAVMPEDDRAGLFGVLGIHTIDALPYQAWSKPIESFFGAWTRRYENLLPGWCGSDAKKKPEKLQRELKDGLILPWGEFAALFDRMVVDWNTGEPVGDRDRSPLNHYVEGAYEPRTVGEQSLTMLLARHGRYKVQDHGIMLYQDKSMCYQSPELALFVGCVADVLVDPWQPDAIWAKPNMDMADDDFAAAFGCGPVLRVSRAEMGSYREYGDPEIEAQRARKWQRQVVGMRMEEVAGAASLDAIDPLGAFRLAAEGQKRVQAALADRAVGHELPTPALPAPEAHPAVEPDDAARRRREALARELAEEEALLDETDTLTGEKKDADEPC